MEASFHCSSLAIIEILWASIASFVPKDQSPSKKDLFLPWRSRFVKTSPPQLRFPLSTGKHWEYNTIVDVALFSKIFKENHASQ